ncbi:MAG: dehydrogenase (quinone) [Chloroflexi bacterium]|nr:dehydrogenase (quinone) [Chloroflexota bacterium]
MRLLHIVATPRGHESNTIRISNALIEELHLKYDDLTVKVLDLFKADLPAVAGENIESKYKLMTGQELDNHHKSSWDAIEANIKRFLDADIYLITVPMWNFGIPYALKYYIDAIVQPGYLFRYNELGIPEGLIEGKKMVVVTSRGGDYSPNTPLHALDFVEPYLRAIFNFVGIRDIHFINAQPMDISPAARRAAMLKAIDEARALVADNHLNGYEPIESVEFPKGVKPAPLEAYSQD